MKRMKKPELVQQEPALNYFECRDYINQKYDIDIDNFANKTYDDSESADNPYQNFWHTICNELQNDSYFNMYVGEPSEYYRSKYKDEVWSMTVIDLFKKEFSEYLIDEEFLRFWVEW